MSMDKRLRDLERRAAAGDPEAARRLRHARRQAQGRQPSKFERCAEWWELAQIMGLESDPRQEWIWDYVGQSVHEQRREYESNLDEDELEDLDEDEMDERQQLAETAAIYAIEAGLSARSILPSVLDKVVEAINDFVADGPVSHAGMSGRHKAGKAVEWFDLGDRGACFKLYRPFLLAYVEAAFCVGGYYDEGYRLKDITLEMIFRTAERIWECVGDRPDSVEERVDQEVSYIDISTHYPYSTVDLIIEGEITDEEQAIEHARIEPRSNPPRRSRAEWDAIIADMLDGGLDMQAAGKKHGVTHQAISQQLKKRPYARKAYFERDWSGPKPSPKTPKENAVHDIAHRIMYNQSTLEDIARERGVKRDAVTRWLKRYGYTEGALEKMRQKILGGRLGE